ncbi:alpha-1,2-fucosyltransferase [Rhodopila sp.]|uniref:alpha-1,2-fucosyltransferase n=1 Tax=Rhodopila sp. TaxID=2480087 RepID=UPI003D0A93D4
MRERTTSWIYPSLPGGPDYGIIRIAGAGIGNCLYVYFHAVVLAKQANARLIAPTWSSVKIGPLLRMERSLRRYGTMFRAHPDEVHGPMKAVRLASLWPGHTRIQLGTMRGVSVARAGLTIVQATEFSFEGLHQHREMIRDRLLEILSTPLGTRPDWGAGDYAAVHIRLGDFVQVQPEQIITGMVANMRISLAWYDRVIRRVRSVFPNLPIHVFSDGRADELAEILALDGVHLRREPTDIGDLLALAQAKLLIGSNSTFSRWAAFLGDMPSIWLKTKVPPEQPTSDRTAIHYVADNCDMITRESVIAA